jgi:hypothetical protein
VSRSPAAGLRRRNQLDPLAIVGPNPAAAGAGFAAIGNAISDLGQMLDRSAREDERRRAADEGRSAVTRDAEGKLVVRENPFRDDAARQTFARQQGLRYAAELELDGRRQGTDLHAANPLDPAAFEAGWKGFVEGKLSETPEAFREQARQVFDALGIQHRNQIAMAQAAKARADAGESWKARAALLQNDVLSLVQAGQMRDPAYTERVAVYSGHLVDGVNGGFITQDDATLYSRQLADQSEGLGVAATAEKAYRAAGRGPAGMAAAEKLIQETIVGNPDSALAPGQKNALAAQAMGRLRDLEAQRVVEAQDARTRAEADIERLRLGINVDLVTLDGHRRRLLAAGDTEAARRVGQMAEVSREVRGLAQQPLAEVDRLIGGLDAKRAAGTATAVEGETLREAIRIRESKVRGLQADALSYGATVHEGMTGKLQLLNFADPAALQAGVTERMRQARLIAEREGVAVAPFTKPELAQIATLAQAQPSPGEQLDFLARATADLGNEQAADVVLRSLEENGFRGRTGHLRFVLDRWAEGDRVSARRLWGEFAVPAKDIDIESNADKALKQRVGQAYDTERGAVRALQASITGDSRRFNAIRAFERDAGIHIARVRSIGTQSGEDGGALADLYGRQRGIAERGFAAILYPAGTNADDLEAGLRARRDGIASEFAKLFPEGVARMQFERTAREATWVNAGDGYALFVPGAGRPLAGPDGRPLVVGLDAILEAGRAVRAGQRARIGAAAATGRQGVGGIVGADDPLAAMGAASEAERRRTQR